MIESTKKWGATGVFVLQILVLVGKGIITFGVWWTSLWVRSAPEQTAP